MKKEIVLELLENLVERAAASDKNKFLTTREIEALDFAVGILRGDPSDDLELKAIPEIEAKPRSSFVKLKSIKIGKANLEDGRVLCIDFGTSFSKAFASVNAGPGQLKIIDLAIGDGSTGTALTTPSELLIDGGRIYFGVHARQRLNSIEGSSDRLIDSIKQYITLGTDVSELSLKQLDLVLDPSGKFSKRDILVLYLAHLTHLTEAALGKKGISENTRRRFTHPAWLEKDRLKNESEMRILMAQSIILARSVGPEIAVSMSVDDANSLLVQLRDVKEESLPLVLIDVAVREATAAGAGALLATVENRREVFLIVDIGAGTTDVAGFVCVNNPNKNVPIVSEIMTAANAKPTAGNALDNLFQQYVLEDSKLAPGSNEYKAAALSIRLNRRLLKETLFKNGSVLVPLPTGAPIRVQLNEFLTLPRVVDFNETLRALVAESGVAAAGDLHRINLVATGGGAALPIIRQLVEDGIEFGKKRVAFTQVDLLAEGIRDSNPELVELYPQIAVALGGALPTLPKPVTALKSGIDRVPKRQIGPIYKQ